ncbi:MAG: hypothetical protein RBS43_04100 [Candidatus Cloacimonas sp.]|jgi:hypothetical protein|nr:hypothetical protein [Candidatus Cloacimonas sp.]
MLKNLLPVWILLCVCLPLMAVQPAQEAVEIASAIAQEIQTGEPVFLELHTGEWTPALSQQIALLLIERGADLRTTYSPDNSELEPAAGHINLANFGLESALLVQVELNVKWLEVVQRNFFSYRSERRPIYSFETKQILLPQQRLIKVSSYDFNRPNSPDTEISRLRMRWFEPLVASAAVASMIFLLWNFN